MEETRPTPGYRLAQEAGMSAVTCAGLSAGLSRVCGFVPLWMCGGVLSPYREDNTAAPHFRPHEPAHHTAEKETS
jgi:hypothetical protein